MVYESNDNAINITVSVLSLVFNGFVEVVARTVFKCNRFDVSNRSLSDSVSVAMSSVCFAISDISSSSYSCKDVCSIANCAPTEALIVSTHRSLLITLYYHNRKSYKFTLVKMPCNSSIGKVMGSYYLTLFCLFSYLLSFNSWLMSWYIK